MYLFTVLSDPLDIEFLASDPGDFVRSGDRDFREVKLDPNAFLFLGFYDWLRTATGDVVGVQLIFHHGRDHVREVLRSACVGGFDGPHFFRLLFVDGVEIDEDRSVDQEFSTSRCYRACDETVALVFEASELAESDIRRLARRSSR